LAVTDAVSCVSLTKDVLNGVPLNCTVAPETKLVPFTVSVNAGLPAAAENGLTSEIVWALATPAANKATAPSVSNRKRDPTKRDSNMSVRFLCRVLISAKQYNLALTVGARQVKLG
jgi:hypothetical protein